MLEETLRSGAARRRGALRPVHLAGFVWIGGVLEARSIGFLLMHRITHVLNCGTNVTAGVLPDGVFYMQLGALDTAEYDMGKHAAAVEAFLDNARARGGQALVHCHAGANRSVTAALAYLVGKGYDLAHLAFAVAASRPCLTNPTFRAYLSDLGAQSKSQP